MSFNGNLHICLNENFNMLACKSAESAAIFMREQ